MNDDTLPIPATGGSFIRQPNGSLEPAPPIDAPEAMPDAVDESAAKPTKKAAKAPVKEG